MKFNNSFGRYLTSMKEKKGFNDSSFAKLLDRHRPNVISWLTGLSLPPTFDDLFKIAEKLKMTKEETKTLFDLYVNENSDGLGKFINFYQKAAFTPPNFDFDN